MTFKTFSQRWRNLLSSGYIKSFPREAFFMEMGYGLRGYGLRGMRYERYEVTPSHQSHQSHPLSHHLTHNHITHNL